MNKILLALAILGAGTARSLTARHSTIRLQREASATRESWVVQTQVLAAAQGERARLAEAAMERVQADLKDWAISHTERSEPRDDVAEREGFELPNETAHK